jgi:hypothetical protein
LSIPNPTQAEFPSKLRCLFQPARYKILYGGRGGTKSWGAGRALPILGAQQKHRILCTREFQNSIKESVHKLLSDQIVALGLESFYRIQQTSITGANGTEFFFEGLKHNATKIKSMEGVTICWIEEAQTISDASLDLLIPTIRTPGSELWFTFNPDLEDDPVYRRFVIHPPPDSVVVKIGWQDNPWFPEVLRKEKDHLKAVDLGAYLNVWEGECRQQVQDALWSKALLEECYERREDGEVERQGLIDRMKRIVVAVDPSGCAGEDDERSDEVGIVVAGLGHDGLGRILEDASGRYSPDGWAKKSLEMYERWSADRIVAEKNFGGAMVEHTIRTVRKSAPIKLVNASRGKVQRAEPVAALYQQGKVKHVGHFAELERQCCLFSSAGYKGKRSPDRADAAIWALTELMIEAKTFSFGFAGR